VINQATGAMPGDGARPPTLYPSGPGWAAYRLPFPGTHGIVTAREVGIGFEGEPSGDPPAGGDPAKPPAQDPPPPATGGGEPDADGMTTDAGRRALAAERERNKTLQKQLEELQAKTQTDDEKRDASLKAAAAKERDEYWSARIRTSEVRSALRAKGITDDKQLNLAASAPEFASLTVDEEGHVADLDKTIEQFTKDYPALFAARRKEEPTRGPQGGSSGDRPKTLGDAIAARLSGAKA
jgi:hypothetical protein